MATSIHASKNKIVLNATELGQKKSRGVRTHSSALQRKPKTPKLHGLPQTTSSTSFFSLEITNAPEKTKRSAVLTLPTHNPSTSSSHTYRHAPKQPSKLLLYTLFYK